MLVASNSRQIPLKAIVDPDVTIVYWFVNEAYVGSSSNGTPFLWDSKPGQFKVLAVDDSGRSSATQLRVTQSN